MIYFDEFVMVMWAADKVCSVFARGLYDVMVAVVNLCCSGQHRKSPLVKNALPVLANMSTQRVIATIYLSVGGRHAKYIDAPWQS
jgi:hypothetical protein